MSKFLRIILFCPFVLIFYFLLDFRTLFVFIVVGLIVVVVVRFEGCFFTKKKKLGTVSYSKCYLTKKERFKARLPRSNNRVNNILNTNNCLLKNDKLICKSYSKLDRIRTDSFDSSVGFSRFCQTDMSFLRSSSSSSLLNSSPVRRPLSSRNDDNSNGGSHRNSMTDLNRSSNCESRTSGNMSVGEFPLISLVSSLHEAVSPKQHKFKPSPVRIRIQPIQPTEPLNEFVVDPVVSVLKQIASNKRVLAPTNTTGDEEQKEKRCRSMPRHDLTHSLLESQLTINSHREGGNSKREREEAQCGTASICGVPGSSAPKRMCARSLRSNEILSSLSSSVSLVSPPSTKTYTGKRKNMTCDKYKKMRKIEGNSSQMKSPVSSPVKVDKGINVDSLPEKPSLPVITIKRDQVSERVVSRAMVSALLKSTVAKLIMSGDPAVYPVPCGNESRQPEVTPPEFGPPKKVTTSVVPPTVPTLQPQPPGLTFNLPQTDKPSVSSLPTTTQPAGFSFGVQQTSTTASVTLPTVTTPLQIPSSTGTPQIQFNFDKPQVSTSAVPSFDLTRTTPVSAVSTTSTTTALPQFGVPTTSSLSTAPSLVIPSLTKTTTSTTLPVFGTDQQIKVPSFALSPATSIPTSVPNFGLGSSVVSTPASPISGFKSISSNETKTTVSVPSFASVIAASTAAPTVTPLFGLPLTTSSTVLSPTVSTPSNLFSSHLTPTTSAPVKFDLTPTTSSTVVSTPIFGSSSSSTGSTVINAPIFGAGAVTSSVSAPTFGSLTSTTTSNSVNPVSPITTTSSVFGTASPNYFTPIFGSSVSGAKQEASAPTTSASSNIFGSSASVFGGIMSTTSAPVFSGSSLTTTSSNIFSTNPTTSATPIFGVATTTTTTSTPLFGAGVSTSSTTPLFGTVTTASAPLFGSTNTTAPVFGGSISSTTTATPIFRAPTSLAPSSTLFGGSTVATTQTPLFGTGTTSFATGNFGGTSTSKPSEGLFSIPSSSSGFKASSPFQVGDSDGGSTTSAFGGTNTSGQPKTFEFGGAKPAAGGFTFKSSGTVTAFSTTAPGQSATSAFSQQPPAQTPFSFTGAGTTVAPSAGNTPFVFGTPQSQPPVPTATAKPFQFGTGAPTNTAPAFGQSFTPTFGQTPATPNLTFGTPTAPAQAGFQFNATQPAAPGGSGGLFSIGTGSTGSRARDRRERRRR